MSKETKEKVSFKTPSIADGSKKMYELLNTIETIVSKMPDCGIKKSYMVTLETFQKKVVSVVKKEQIAKALSAIRKNPELLNSLPDDVKASFASSDDNIAPVIDAEKEGAVENVKKAKKNK